MSTTLYVFRADGTCAEKQSLSKGLTPALEAAYIKKMGADIYLSEWPSDPYPEILDVSELTADIEDGQVIDILAPEILELFLHLKIDAPGSGPTGIPSVAKGETATLTATMRETAVEDSAVVEYTGFVRAPYYKNGAYHSDLRMYFEAGVCVYIFEPESHQHGRLTVNEEEIGELNGYKIRVVGDKELIVDQVSAA